VIDGRNATKMRHQGVGKRGTADMQHGLLEAIHRGIDSKSRARSETVA
jgi:hypothetical protein